MPIHIRQGPLIRRLPLVQPQPSEPQEIDWANAVAQGLSACYLPTEWTTETAGAGTILVPTLRDLTRNTDLAAVFSGSGVRNKIDTGMLGVEAQDGVAAISGTHGWTGVSSTNQRPNTTASLFVRARVLSAGASLGNSPEIFTCTNSNANSSPFTAYGLQRNSANKVQLAWNVGGTFASLASTSTLTTGGIYNLGGVLLTDGVAGHSQIYVNGTLEITGTPASGSIFYGATSSMVLLGKFAVAFPGMAVSVAYAWNRVVTADEMKWLNADPYMLLRSRRPRRFITGAAAVAALYPPQISMIY